MECVHGQCHVMVQFNLKCETKGRPFDVCRLSQPVPSINYDLIAADQSYASKFYEPNVQEVVELNRSVFEPDADAVTEALENLRNNQGNIIHSFDPINDQEYRLHITRRII